jgi:hypothetical protein
MSIWQNTDGSNNISRRSNSSISSIGIIGGTFSPKRDPLLEEKYHNWIEEFANIIQPCSHTMEETEQYFLQQCEAVPMDKGDNRMKGYQYSVVMNYKIQDRISELPLDMNIESIEKWNMVQSDIRRELMNTLPEHYGIKTSGYYLPQTERNLYLYEEFRSEIERITKHKEDIIMHTYCNDMCFFFERTTGDIQCSNGGRSLINRLLAYRGVSEEDIELRNVRFQGYLSSMRELGNISVFR